MKISSSSTTFQTTKEINPNFYSVWNTKKPYIVLSGGRSSFKSSVVALMLVFKMLIAIKQNQTVEIVIVRKVANTIADSVYNKILWALNKFHIMHQFTPRKSPYKIIHKGTKSTFHFYGQDDFQKLKSNDVGGIIAVWYEEASEFKNAEEFDQSNSTFMRQKHPEYPYVQFIWSYNPPRNPYNWINEWSTALQDSEEYLVHRSSYLDDELGFVTEQMLNEIERIKQNDYDYYRYLYLGEAVGLGTNVYNMDNFHLIDEVPNNERLPFVYFATDGGHQQSATACLCIGLSMRYGEKPKVYVLDTYYYSPRGKVRKKAPSQLSKEIRAFELKMLEQYPVTSVRNRTIDSAEGALRNQYFEDFNIRLHPVSKLRKIQMTEYVQSLLANGQLYVVKTENNVKYFLDEHKRYTWIEDTVFSENPQVVKEDDHTCDAFEYFVIDNKRDLGLEF